MAVSFISWYPWMSVYHRHAAGKDRKNELSEGQSKKHTLRIITDFLIYLDFQS